MAILSECPLCHKKQATKNKLCSCGADLDKLKGSKKVRYWINYRLNGKQCRKMVGSFEGCNPYSIEDARTVQSQWMVVNKKENRVEIFDVKVESKMTFSELTEWYLDLVHIKDKRSYKKMEARLKRFNSVLGDRAIGKIGTTNLKNLQVLLQKDGLTDSYVDDVICQARTMLNEAVNSDDEKVKNIGSNVLEPFTKLKRLLKTNTNARDRILSREEFSSLLRHSARHLLYTLSIGYYTGMRRGEILNLTWNKVNMKNHLIQLEAIDTKTGEPRVCPIVDNLHKILSSIPRGLHDNHVILYYAKPIKDIRTSLKTACRKAGIVYGRKERGGFTYHDLRHTFNTYMRKAGVDKEVIKAITGHETDAMFSRYNKIDSEDIQVAAAQYQKFLSVDQSVDQEDNKGGNGQAK